ncbi:TolC family outer membrane protein [Polaromonas sp.]|uniref:TolC family outer membrane protein n=1 Tax=Polaromonas sp. TaxID=1869339 RepID=UPI0013BB2FBA|nr:TolC family outer membrane protein [Polaromonas sp.]NDP61207.1 TolC family outer membrane protein [Polaromonas sp.]
MKQHHFLAAAALALCAVSAQATDLMQAWQAARQHDPQAAVADAARAAGETRRAQAASLWRPNVALSGGAGRMSANSATSGAQFAAPGFGQSSGVSFDTSVNNGSSTRWSVTARQPLYNPERSAQRQQLEIGADSADLQWQAAQQDLMLVTTQRYFDMVLAERKLALLRQQQTAVDRAFTEAKDRFELGDAPITDTHEASARARGLQAQVLAAQSELELAQTILLDATGLSPDALQVMAPAGEVAPRDLPPLAQWLTLAQENNPLLRLQRANADAARQETRKHSALAAPTLDLVAQAGRERLSGSGDFGAASNTSRQQMIGLQLNVPLYTGGMRSAKLDEALRLEDKARAEVELASQQTRQQTRAAWLGLQTGQARLSALAEAVTASQARLGATRLGRQVGDRTTLDLLNAENDASAADLALLQARIEVLQNRLRLQALAGQLDEAQLLQVSALLQN